MSKMVVSWFPDASAMQHHPSAVLQVSSDFYQLGKICPGDLLAFLPWPAFHSLFFTHDQNHFYGNHHSLSS